MDENATKLKAIKLQEVYVLNLWPGIANYLGIINVTKTLFFYLPGKYFTMDGAL
jgi:hypothetical protein